MHQISVYLLFLNYKFDLYNYLYINLYTFVISEAKYFEFAN